MSVPKGKRSISKFEVQHHFFKASDEVTALILNDFVDGRIHQIDVEEINHAYEKPVF